MTVYKFKTPISEEEIRKLKVNDVLYVTGTIVTARDQAHRRALEYFKQGKRLPINLEGLAVFHCGPVVSKEGEKWIAVAAGQQQAREWTFSRMSSSKTSRFE